MTLKLLIFIGMTLGSALGWWLGEKIGLLSAVALSTVLGCVGVYLGWKVNQVLIEG